MFHFKPALWACFALLLSAGASNAADYQIHPKTIQLLHANDRQQATLLEFAQGRCLADLTRSVEWTVSDPNVAYIDETGVVRPIGDGDAMLSATISGETVNASIRVSGVREQRLWSFVNDVQPSLTKIGCNAGACHGSASGKNGFKLSLRGYDHDTDYNVISREAKGRRILLAEPENSLLLQKPVGDVPHGGGRLMRRESLDYLIIKEWIAQQAPGPDDNDKALVRISVFPDNARLSVGDELQLVVTAYFDDGSRKDVTHWTKFGATDDGVMVIDDEGLAEIKRPGSAALTVWYSGKVGFASVEVPYETDVDPAVFAQAERKNFIDEKILDKLKALNIPPSGMANDAAFVRRAYLDAIGVLPAVRETVSFLLDKDEDKRAKLIDSLLERSEYVDYWSYKWSDLMLVSTENSGLNSREAVMAYYGFIRDSVERNLGWDRFVEAVLTAQGSTLENGAANFFVLHKETTALTETVSVAFMGLSITCARCHNHPMEKWTQDDYYGMANLLSRVRLKNGDRGGETFVRDGSSGDLIHPVYNKPLQPKPLDGEPIALNEAGRRAALAKWMTSPDNPYFARAIINRVWKHFMGVGLVEPEDDLRLTNPPSNEALFAALEADFVENGYDVKRLIKTIMNSAAYQRSSQAVPGNESDERNYSRYVARRLPAEVILDAYSAVTQADTDFAGYPDGWRALQLPDSAVASQFLEAFGRPERKQTCSCERDATPTLAQALHVSNGDTLNHKLQHEDNMIDRFLESGLPLDDFIFDLYFTALCRAPSTQEADAIWSTMGGQPGWRAMSAEEQRLALEDIAWALLSGKEFLFNH